MAQKLFFNGNIITMDEKNPFCNAVLIRDDTILETGSKEDLLRLTENGAEYIDLNGQTMIPGFIDAHSHFMGYAMNTLKGSVHDADNSEKLIACIKEYIKSEHIPPLKWVQMAGFDGTFSPSIEDLNKAAPDNPLVIENVSGHSGFMNSLGLAGVNINDNTPDPDGGRMGRTNGKLNGYLEENAFITAVQKIPMPTLEEIEKAVKRAEQKYFSYGITTAQEGMMVKSLAELYAYISSKALLDIDIVAYADISEADEIHGLLHQASEKYINHFKIGGYKIFLDGSPQGHTAWMKDGYLDKSVNGYPIHSDEELKQLTAKALREDMQLIAHCNGDAACEQFIRCYSEEYEKKPYNIRPVMVHAQLLEPDMLRLMKEPEIIPSFFTAHIWHWGDVHIKNFGHNRAQTLSPAGSAKKAGITFTMHQDAPVIEPDMLETIWCAVLRITQKGQCLGSDERIDIMDALKALTINGAYQYFEEDSKGSISRGKKADFAVIDKNILDIPKADIRSAKITAVYKNGQLVFNI